MPALAQHGARTNTPTPTHVTPFVRSTVVLPLCVFCTGGALCGSPRSRLPLVGRRRSQSNRKTAPSSPPSPSKYRRSVGHANGPACVRKDRVASARRRWAGSWGSWRGACQVVLRVGVRCRAHRPWLLACHSRAPGGITSSVDVDVFLFDPVDMQYVVHYSSSKAPINDRDRPRARPAAGRCSC